MLKKKILIAIPTYNRSEIVSYLLSKISDIINKTPNLFLGFYDSSTDCLTENIIRPYLSSKIIYKKYEPGLSEEKGLDILKNESLIYDYIWFCSDRKVLNLNLLLPMIEQDLNSGVDLVFFANNKIKRKEISDYKELGLWFFEITNLAKFIVSSRMSQYMAQSKIYNKYIGSHLAIQASVIDFCGCNSFQAVQYALRDQDIAETGAVPFRHEWSDNAVWQWSKSWCDTIEALPDTYNTIKSEMIKKNNMFSFKKVIARKATGTEYRAKDIKTYKEYIKRVDPNMHLLFIGESMPSFILIFPYKIYKKIKNKSAKKDR